MSEESLSTESDFSLSSLFKINRNKIGETEEFRPNYDFMNDPLEKERFRKLRKI